ncbi:MAG: Na-translocating system protein MpsC family protein [Thermosynechococcaceae cyanobacterium]
MPIDSQQIEPLLAQRVATTYQTLMGHSLDLVSCHFLNSDTIAVVLDGAVTQPEKLLLSSGYGDLARIIRQHLNAILRPRLIAEVEAVLQREVIDAPSDIKFESERMSLMMVLAKPLGTVQNTPMKEAAEG